MNTNTSEKPYVYIGRFQGAHQAHVGAMHYALDHADHLIILVGSSELARDPKNPFTFEERKQVIEAITDELMESYRQRGLSKKVSVLPIRDYVYDNNKWLQEVQSQVMSVTGSHDITLTGCDKDDSTFYLKFFPQWGQDFFTQVEGISSTQVREVYFETDAKIIDGLPKQTVEFLEKFTKRHNGETYSRLKAEYEFYKDYKAQFSMLPYPPVFVTGDAVVTCAGHLLVVERGGMPGKGLWALPGGFINQKETVEECIIRELTEETELNMKVPNGVIARAVRGNVTVFDAPDRSLRGRTITHCGKIVLHDIELPKIRGSDDAAKAFWVPIAEVVKNRSKFFEDHYSIISCQLSL